MNTAGYDQDIIRAGWDHPRKVPTIVKFISCSQLPCSPYRPHPYLPPLAFHANTEWQLSRDVTRYLCHCRSHDGRIWARYVVLISYYRILVTSLTVPCLSIRFIALLLLWRQHKNRWVTAVTNTHGTQKFWKARMEQFGTCMEFFIYDDCLIIRFRKPERRQLAHWY